MSWRFPIAGLMYPYPALSNVIEKACFDSKRCILEVPHFENVFSNEF